MPPGRGGLSAGPCAGGGQELAGPFPGEPRVSQKTIGDVWPADLESGETAGDQGGPDDALAARPVTGAPNAEPPDLHADSCSPRVRM